MSKDTIYRQDAIDMVKDVCDAIMSGCESWYDPEAEDEVYKDILEVDAILKCNKEIRIALRNMPSTQPEPLTDKEQRIFLAAMSREEKVCEEVDKSLIREPYEDSLMRVCKEIRRKVKGALWT